VRQPSRAAARPGEDHPREPQPFRNQPQPGAAAPALRVPRTAGMRATGTASARLAGLMLPAAANAAPPAPGGLDQAINNAFAPVADAVSWLVFHPVPIGFGASMPFVVLWLLVAALAFTLYFRFINLRGFAHGFR